MEIIEYNDKYLEDVKDLLVELEEYIVSIDKDGLDQLHSDYREKMAILDLEEVAIYIINTMLKLYPTQIKERYNIENETDIVDILDKIGKKIGAIRNHETDYEKVYTTVLKDLREGYLGRITFDREV